MVELRLTHAAETALALGNPRHAIAVTLVVELTRIADNLLTLAGLEDTAAGQDAYAVAQTLCRQRVAELGYVI